MPTGKGVANQFSSAPSEGVDTISERLLQARRSAMPLPAFPGTLPSDLETAYAVQHRSIHKWPDEVARCHGCLIIQSKTLVHQRHHLPHSS